MNLLEKFYLKVKLPIGTVVQNVQHDRKKIRSVGTVIGYKKINNRLAVIVRKIYNDKVVTVLVKNVRTV